MRVDTGEFVNLLTERCKRFDSLRPGQLYSWQLSDSRTIVLVLQRKTLLIGRPGEISGQSFRVKVRMYSEKHAPFDRWYELADASPITRWELISDE